MSANVVPLEPKSKQGNTRTKYNTLAWSVRYNPITKTFHWSVTVPVKPQVFAGESGSMADAEKEVAKIVATFK